MPVREGHRLGSCPFSSRSSDSMEVVDSPLNLAHQQCRKADRLLAAHKFEEAISCHGKAADLLTEAIKTTECDQARLSIELQRDSHIKQQQLIQERWKREIRREATKLGSAPPGCPAPLLSQPHRSLAASSAAPALGGAVEREYDTLLYQLQSRQSGPPPAPPPPGSKTTKDDKTRLEEQQTTIQDLRRLVDHLINENQRLAADNELLRSDNAALRSEQASELWVLPHANAIATVGPEEEGGRSNKKGKEIAIPQLPPLEMPAQEDLCLDDLPPLELPEDIRNELQELLDRDKA